MAVRGKLGDEAKMRRRKEAREAGGLAEPEEGRENDDGNMVQ